MNIQEEERIKLRLYQEFGERNTELLKQDPILFAHEQRIYVEKEIKKIYLKYQK